MRHTWWALVLVLGATAAQAEEAGVGHIVVTALDVEGRPVSDLAVTVVAQGGEARSGKTDANGRAVFDLPAGSYQVTAAFGSLMFTQQTITVEPGDTVDKTYRFNPRTAVEEVVIRQQHDLAAPPKVRKNTLPRKLEYTDEAIDQNVWGTVWLLLRVTAKGDVVKAEVLKAPADLALDPVALDVVKKVKFRPALDKQGRPKAFKVLWRMDWEPYWAKRDRFTGKASIAVCQGSGPLNMNFVGTRVPIEVAYRDCTPPAGYENVKLVPVHPETPRKPDYHDPGRKLNGPVDDPGEGLRIPVPNPFQSLSREVPSSA